MHKSKNYFFIPIVRNQPDKLIVERKNKKILLNDFQYFSTKTVCCDS